MRWMGIRLGSWWKLFVRLMLTQPGGCGTRWRKRDVLCRADLKALAAGKGNKLSEDGDGPMGPTRMLLSKPVIAAVEGHAVAGGLELACWCDLRVAARDAVFGVYLPALRCSAGGSRDHPASPAHRAQSRAGPDPDRARGSGDEAQSMGLANRLVDPGGALDAALELAHDLARLPADVHAV